MKLLHYLEIENFKTFGARQRLDLENPSVFIGPNNAGKTSAIQALAFWSLAVKTWYAARKNSPAKERTATGINRLNIVAVPVQKTRFFWKETKVRNGNELIEMSVAVGVLHENRVKPLRKGDYARLVPRLSSPALEPEIIEKLDLIALLANRA